MCLKPDTKCAKNGIVWGQNYRKNGMGGYHLGENGKHGKMFGKGCNIFGMGR